MLFIQSELLRQAGVVHGFSVRTGGVSVAPFDSLNLGSAVGDDPAAVDRNRQILFDAVGIPLEHSATVNQVHGDRVVFARLETGQVVLSDSVYGAALSDRVDADAIVGGSDVTVGVRTADCVPILLHDPRSGASAAVHAGWRGTMARIAERAVEALREAFQTDPGDLLAAIGPAIGPCCFEVAPDVAGQFAAAFGADVVTPATDMGPRVDLFTANQRLLGRAGLRAARIETLRRCTFCEQPLFFSHRRDKGTTGRHLSFVAARRAK